MKRIFAFLTGLIALLINLPVFGQQSSAPPYKDIPVKCKAILPTTKDDKSLLWRISGKNLTTPSYLFGTIHLICKDDYLWTDKMKQSLANSEKVCFEMDLDDPSVMMQVAMGLIDNSGKKLKDYFTPEQYQMLQRYFKDSMGMELSLYEQLKPVALQTMLSTKNTGCANPVSYEETIMASIKDKKEILGLEDPKEQIAVLESIPVDTVIQQLLDEVQNKNRDKDDAEYSRLLSAYKQQNLPELYNLITSAKEPGNDMGVFLDERNKKWIPRMQNKMNKSSVFFAVGAGHLYGPTGVIDLLRKEGYAVEPLK